MPEKLKIDGNSWHCKLYHAVWTGEPEDLCSYVRGIFTSLLIVTGTIGLAASVLLLLEFHVCRAIKEFG